MVLGALIVLALTHPSHAQQPAVSAELKRVIGRVEILRKGQTQWVPAVVGAHLVEGDDIRAFSGAQAELVLPDTSTVVLAENSRLLLTKLEFDRKNQSRTVLLHLAVGKVRAAIAQASITLVRARQSNFAISTPTAVAAARGTVVWAIYDGRNTLYAVETERTSGLLPSRVDCIPLAGVAAGGPLTGQTVFAGSMSIDCGAVTPITAITFSNPTTANSPVLLGAPVVVPPRALEAATVNLTAGTPTTAPMSFNTNGGSVPTAASAAARNSFGQNLLLDQQQSGQNVQVNQQLSVNQQNNTQEMTAGQSPPNNNQ
jgi:hypothetical protein